MRAPWGATGEATSFCLCGARAGSGLETRGLFLVSVETAAHEQSSASQREFEVTRPMAAAGLSARRPSVPNVAIREASAVCLLVGRSIRTALPFGGCNMQRGGRCERSNNEYTVSGVPVLAW